MSRFNPLSYPYSILTANQPRLVMTILCRNEVDIIAANIHTHAKLGVDAFIVMDNGSTDGTRDVLSSLSQQYDLQIIDQNGMYQQAKWMTQLANHARKAGAHWVINNDADEFWLPLQGESIKDLLYISDSTVTVSKSNMLLTEDMALDNILLEARYRVCNTILYDAQTQINNPHAAIFFAKLAHKVIVNPHSLIKISSGNHRAKHWYNWLRARKNPNIRVYHYPIRDYQQFEANIKHRRELLKHGARMGNHYRRWARLLKSGTLHEEYQQFIVNKADLPFLKRYGLIAEDHTPLKHIATS